MKIFVRAKPSAREEKLEKIDETHFVVAVTEPPIHGRANRAIAEALAKHFGVSRIQVCLISGHASRQKIFEIKTIINDIASR